MCKKCSMPKLYLCITAGCVAMIMLMTYSNLIPFEKTVGFLTQKLHSRWELPGHRVNHVAQPVQQGHAVFSGHPPLSHVTESPDTYGLVVKSSKSNSAMIQDRMQEITLTASKKVDNSEQTGGNAVHVWNPLKSNQRYLFAGFFGRLGNVMFKLASAVCIALKNNLTLAVPNIRDIKNIQYDGIKLSREAWHKLTATARPKTLIVRRCHAFNPMYMQLKPRNASYMLKGYFQSWKYFEPCKGDVTRALSFDDTVVSKAVGVVRRLRKKYPSHVLVGVHVRMEDFLARRAVLRGKTVAPPGYYVRAMTYFRTRFPGVVSFVVITSNETWFRSTVSNEPDVMLLGRSASAAVDMEVLSRMDHLIFSVGTFGWWAGYRNKGTVICYKDFFVPGTIFGQHFVNGTGNFIYPGWIQL